MGRESEVFALKCNGNSPLNILVAVLAQSSRELDAMVRGDDDLIKEECVENRGWELFDGYPTEPPQTLGCELVKLRMKPTVCATRFVVV